MEAVKKKVPELRFYDYSEEWHCKKLGEIGEIITGSTPPTENQDYYGGEELFVSPIDIQESRYVDSTATTLTKLGLSKGRLIKENSILFVCIGSTIGKVAQNGKLCITNQQINSVIPFNSYDNNFVFSLLEKNSKYIKGLSAIQAVPIINKTTFSKVEVLVPSMPEQTKIGSFLTAMDDKIRQLTRKKELLEEYKKGVMQRIFKTSELGFIGLKDGRIAKNEDQEILESSDLKNPNSDILRFRDEEGKEYPEWQKVKLEVLIKSIMAGKSKPQIDGQFNVYGSMGIIGKSGSFSHEGNYLLIARVGANAGSINLVNEKFCVTDNTLVLEPNDLVDSKYLYFSLIQFDLSRLLFGSGQPLITGGQLKKIVISLPTWNEQKKIASILSTIDQRITHVSKQIAYMQTWKKGLLQKMFV